MGFRPPNYTQTPNELFDDWLPKLKMIELKILLVILRKTFGWHKDVAKISREELKKLTGLQSIQISNGTKSLIEKKLIKKTVIGSDGTESSYYELCVEEEEIKIIPTKVNFTGEGEVNFTGDKRKEEKDISKKKEIHKEKESVSPSAPAHLSSSKRIKDKEEKIQRADRVWTTETQHLNLLKRSEEKDELVKRWYERLSVWKIDKEVLNGSDYASILKWVIKAVNQDIKQESENGKEACSAAAEKIAKEIEKQFPEKIRLGHICVGYNYIEFILGHVCQKIYFYEHAFKERVENNLRKMGVSIKNEYAIN